jgi:hypothetical protein
MPATHNLKKSANQKIVFKDQVVVDVPWLTYKGLALGGASPQIWPHLPALLVSSLQRFAALQSK